jgi:membrane associated rhomboid family serine protease
LSESNPDEQDRYDPGSPPERMFNAPWPALAIAVIIIASYAAQGLLPYEGRAYALYPVEVEAGRPLGLLTSLFLHGGWPHALMNAAFGLAFGTPVARLFGLRAAGVIAFFIFYLLCGVIAGLVFVVLHPGGLNPVLGASGAVSGLMGAAARLMDGQGRLGSPFSRSALSMAGAWIAVNLLIAVTGLAPGLEEGSVAWEAHLGGFAAGLLLAGPFARLLRR